MTIFLILGKLTHMPKKTRPTQRIRDTDWKQPPVTAHALMYVRTLNGRLADQWSAPIIYDGSYHRCLRCIRQPFFSDRDPDGQDRTGVIPKCNHTDNTQTLQRQWQQHKEKIMTTTQRQRQGQQSNPLWRGGWRSFWWWSSDWCSAFAASTNLEKSCKPENEIRFKIQNHDWVPSQPSDHDNMINKRPTW